MRFRRLKLSGFKSFVEPAELRIEPALTGGEEHGVVLGRIGARPCHQLLVVKREGRLAGDDVEREPGARLVAFVQVVVDQAGMARERYTLARGAEVGLRHHAILEVGELVGGGGE